MANIQSQSQVEFQQSQDDRPTVEPVAIGNRKADLSFSAIAGIYEKTARITDTSIAKVDASPVL